MSVTNKDQPWELPKVPGEYTGWKKVEVKGPPRPSGGPSWGVNCTVPMPERYGGFLVQNGNNLNKVLMCTI